jgi:putative membrane protein
MMWDWNGWFWGWSILHAPWSLLYLALIIVVIVVIVRAVGRSGHHNPALALLEERYAKGEIDRNEYLEKKRDLGG